MKALLSKLLGIVKAVFKGLARLLGPVPGWLWRGLKWIGRGPRWIWRGVKRVWGWIKISLRHLRNYYEPWMMSVLLLVAAGALIYGFWVFNWQPPEADLRLIMIPATLGLMLLLSLGLIAFSFWKPNARNFFTTPFFLLKLYRPWMLTVASLAAIGAMTFGFWKLNASNPAAIQPKPKVDDSISLRFEDVELRGRKQGTPFFTILADKVDVSKNNELVTFKKGKTKPHGEFYNLKDWEEDPTGGLSKRRAITWEANQAIFNTVDQNLKMLGAVKIKTDAGDTIVTEEMLWNRNDQTLISNTRTKVHTHQDTYLESNRLKVETKNKALFLEGRVSIDMKLNQEKVIDVEKFEQ